jgi:hypothetical protein
VDAVEGKKNQTDGKFNNIGSFDENKERKTSL